ncbi:transmembrane prolyl 4-hydroxylase-like [Anneissia japonica]|uniref:transmembrane prolyl 4-hydroxylase-like n=1 Tax=Anneissia japonica TaxID=1529436 RepID=UPI00142592A2|nr:transmembrane prolyl 4-hydroxylase-like [Anneissia japonica]
MYFSLILILFAACACEDIPDLASNVNPYGEVKYSKLSRLNPVSVGHEQIMKTESGKTLTIKTAAVNPPIFEIENYLTDAECEYIKGLAEKKADWKQSITLPNDGLKGHFEGGHKLSFETADKNNDGVVDVLEFWKVRPPVQNSMITIEDIPEFLQLHNYDEDGDEKLTASEFSKIDVKLMYQKEMSRVNNFFLFQIVYYEVGGHYHAHFDTSAHSKSIPCINTRELDGVDGNAKLDYSNYRLCRYITIMYYLNDVEEGGETAFPIADNATASEQVLFAGGQMGDLSNHCKDARLIVTPKKGKAVMWYNHLLNEEGWLGQKDSYSFHGGCDIKKGVKWIANHWIPIDSDRERQLRYLDFCYKKYPNKRTISDNDQEQQQNSHQEDNDHHQQNDQQQPLQEQHAHQEEGTGHPQQQQSEHGVQQEHRQAYIDQNDHQQNQQENQQQQKQQENQQQQKHQHEDQQLDKAENQQPQARENQQPQAKDEHGETTEIPIKDEL